MLKRSHLRMYKSFVLLEKGSSLVYHWESPRTEINVRAPYVGRPRAVATMHAYSSNPGMNTIYEVACKPLEQTQAMSEPTQYHPQSA
jgi:hypothetical protein